MFVDRILFPVTALGPGNRIAIWLAGCHRKCLGCANPELWVQKPSQQISVKKLSGLIRQTAVDRRVDGLTISGGEPFEQSDEVLDLLRSLSDLHLNTLVFSGCKLEELQKREIAKEAMRLIDVLIDGEYIREQNDGKAALRGSLNQRINILNPDCQAVYETYLQTGRQIQNFVYGNVILSVGIHSEDKAKE